MVYLMGYLFFVVFLAFFLLSLLNKPVYKGLATYEKYFLVAKDQKMQLLRSILMNIKFIKIKAWENFYFSKLYLKRLAEIEAVKKSDNLVSMLIAVNWYNPTTVMIFAVLAMVIRNKFLEAA
jgi:hypothetical protein